MEQQVNLCAYCQRQFKTPGGLTRHVNAAHPVTDKLQRMAQAPGTSYYFFAADIEVTVNGQLIKAKSIEFDSTKDKAPRVRFDEQALPSWLERRR